MRKYTPRPPGPPKPRGLVSTTVIITVTVVAVLVILTVISWLLIAGAYVIGTPSTSPASALAPALDEPRWQGKRFPSAADDMDSVDVASAVRRKAWDDAKNNDSAEEQRKEYERKMKEHQQDKDLRSRYRTWLALQDKTSINLSDMLLGTKDYTRKQVILVVGGKPQYVGWATGRQETLVGFSLYDVSQPIGDRPMAYGFIDSNEVTPDKKTAYHVLSGNSDRGKQSLVLATVAWADITENGYRNLIIYGITLPPPDQP